MTSTYPSSNSLALRINPKFLSLGTSDTRYFVVTGGRGSGKSFSVNTIITGLTFERGHRVLFTRYTMASAHLSIIPEFIEKIDLMRLQSSFSINKTDIQNKRTGNEIIFRGIKTSSGNQVANLKSLQGVTTWVLDEAQELDDEGVFDDIDLSVREDKAHNRVILILNPATKEHWIYRRFFEERGVPEGFTGIKGDTTYIHTTYLDNIENLSESFIANIERIKQNNPKKYHHKILGGWMDRAEGVVFDRWAFGEFNPDKLQTSFGLDFGYSVDPDALIEVAIDKKKKKLYLKEHIYSRGLRSEVLGRRILECAGNLLVVADSAEPRLIDDLLAMGVNIRPVKKGTIESGVTRMQDYEIIVDPDSQNLAKELNNYAYADKGSKLYVDDWNHGIDASRYNVTYHLDDPMAGEYFVY